VDHPRDAAVTTTSEQTTLGNFCAVDAVPETTTPSSRALDEQASAPAIQRLRATATELIRPRRGNRIVDVGCGTGETTGALAPLVGPDDVERSKSRDTTRSPLPCSASGRRTLGLRVGVGLRAWPAPGRASGGAGADVAGEHRVLLAGRDGEG
jgi:hypothetical protein